jgi:hypothetical protein
MTDNQDMGDSPGGCSTMEETMRQRRSMWEFTDAFSKVEITGHPGDRPIPLLAQRHHVRLVASTACLHPWTLRRRQTSWSQLPVLERQYADIQLGWTEWSEAAHRRGPHAVDPPAQQNCLVPNASISLVLTGQLGRLATNPDAFRHRSSPLTGGRGSDGGASTAPQSG